MAHSSVVRARRARQAAAAGGSEAAPALPPPEHESSSFEWRAVRRRWAQLVRWIHEVDPLLCPRCGGTMCITAGITESRVIGKNLKHLQVTGVDARSPAVADRPHPSARSPQREHHTPTTRTGLVPGQQRPRVLRSPSSMTLMPQFPTLCTSPTP